MAMVMWAREGMLGKQAGDPSSEWGLTFLFSGMSQSFQANICTKHVLYFSSSCAYSVFIRPVATPSSKSLDVDSVACSPQRRMRENTELRKRGSGAKGVTRNLQWGGGRGFSPHFSFLKDFLQQKTRYPRGCMFLALFFSDRGLRVECEIGIAREREELIF